MSSRPISIEDLARRAEVEARFIVRALESGALGRRGPDQLTEDDEAPVKMLNLWESAGYSVDAIGRAIGENRLSFTFLDAPSIRGMPRVETTYGDFAALRSLDLGAMRRLYEALGLEAPGPADQMREGESDVLDLLAMLTATGASEHAVLRLFRVYADALRRLGLAEAEFFEAEIERPARAAGSTEQDLLDLGVDIGHQVVPAIEKALLAIYKRHRHHVWLDHTLGHVEGALDAAGLATAATRPPSVAFVDLTGFTSLTEELGDEAAADMSGRLASMVDTISIGHEGRPVRWLGDGGMFVFREPLAAVAAALDVVREAPVRGLPPTHIGIHSGPVIFQDGDIYGRTVNLAARLSALAGPGEVLVSAEIAHSAGEIAHFDSIGPVELKGIAQPIQVFRARLA
jgi:adenylate cyclase